MRMEAQYAEKTQLEFLREKKARFCKGRLILYGKKTRFKTWKT